MPVGWIDEKKAPDPSGAKRSSVVESVTTRGSSAKGDDGDDDDKDDDIWALFMRGLTTTYSNSSESCSVESEKPYGYYLNIQGVMEVFNSALEELSLLKRIVNTPVDKSWDFIVQYRPLEQRFGGSRQLVFEESEFDSLNDRQKVQKDICFIYNILRDGYHELIMNETCDSTIDAIKAMFQLLDDENALFEDYDSNVNRIQELKQLLIDEKKDYLKNIAERRYELFMLKDEFEDKLVYGKYNVKYIDEWEGSRIQQNRLLRQLAEDECTKIINDSDTKMSFETRVHNEIATWLETNTEDMNDEIAYWQQHYEEERDRRDLEIYNLKVARDQLIEDLEAMKVLYEQHRIEIEEWLEYRDEKEKREKLEQEQLAAAIKIQAWWRGVMVRRHLGPYRKKKKGKGKGKGKDKGKGKNKGSAGKKKKK